MSSRGAGAFSEPESQALRSLCESQRYMAAVSLHSYSSVLLYPCFSTPEVDELGEEVILGLPALQPHYPYKPIRGSTFFKDNPALRGFLALVRGTEWVHGTFDDWLYEQGTHSPVG